MLDSNLGVQVVSENHLSPPFCYDQIVRSFLVDMLFIGLASLAVFITIFVA